MWPVWAASALVIATCVVATANVALRHFSRAKMAELGERSGRTRRVEALLAHLGELTLMTSTLRMTINLVLVLLLAYMFQHRAGTPALYYLTVFLTSGVLILVFGVAIPSAWAKYAGGPFLLAVAPILEVTRLVAQPVTAFLHLFDGLVRRLAGVPREKHGDGAEQMEQEILNAVSEGEAQGVVDREEKEMIESVMELDDMYVGQVMTPRTEIIALPTTATFFEVKEVIAKEGHSRLPVYDDSLDNVLGVLYAKDLLGIDRTDAFDPTQVMRKVPFVPETKPLRDLLREFQKDKVQIAIVLDEYGGTAGLVTIEDIVEVLVGEIADEFEPPEPEPMKRIDDDTVEVDARVHVWEINEALRVSLPEDEDYETVGGFVFSTLGRIPTAGEEIDYRNVRLRVLEAEERRINRIEVHVNRQYEAAEATGE